EMSAAIRMRIGYLGRHMRASTGSSVGVAQKGGPSQFRRRECCADDNIIIKFAKSVPARDERVHGLVASLLTAVTRGWGVWLALCGFDKQFFGEDEQVGGGWQCD